MYLPTDIDVLACKRLFAEALLRSPHNPFDAARKVFPTNNQAAIFIMQNWQFDDYVKAYQAELLEEHGPDHFLPTMFDLAHEVWSTAQRATDTKERVDAFKLYADIRGFISKPGVNTSNNVENNYTQNVLIVNPVNEQELEEQQRRLMLEAAEDAQ
jgi:hypothetical protein